MKKTLFLSLFVVIASSCSAQVCTAIISHVINGNQVQYFGSSPDNPASWSWFFNGGTPLTSSLQNPVVTYASPGQYISALSISGGPNNCSPALSNKSDTVTIVSTGLSQQTATELSITVIRQHPAQFEIVNNKSQQVKIELHDLNGRLIETIFEGNLLEGKNVLEMKTFNIPAGMYLMTLKGDDGIVSKKFYLQ